MARQTVSAPFRPHLRYATGLALVLLAFVIVGCNTQVAHEPNPTPQAVITPIGHRVTSIAGASTITVRSNADVILSGKDSDGLGVALQTFVWTQTGGPALPALPDARALLYRTANTVSFRAPSVSVPTTLTFQLSVTNARGATGSASIAVSVVPAGDSDAFLVIPNTARRFSVGIVTTDGIGTTSGQPLVANVPVCVQVARQVHYRDRNLDLKTVQLAPPLAPLMADASWAADTVVKGAGAAPTSATVQAAVSDFSNPRVTFEVPEFNDDELLAMFNQPGTAQFAMQLVAADIDLAQLQLSVSATPGSCDQSKSGAALSGSHLIVALLDSSGNIAGNPSAPGAAGQPTTLSHDPTGALLTPDWLLANIDFGAPLETAAFAKAYYQAIDPNAYTANDTKATLQGWLLCNGFNPGASDYGVGAAGANGAHAVYVNNYDLGFGRDMYFLRVTTPPAAPPPGCPVSQAGDMATVVINYASLEQTALKAFPIMAVAMEYIANPNVNAGHRFPRFYIYAPDDRTGQFVRVLSANFDRRGQKYVPNACTPCHGGSPPPLPQGFSAGQPYPTIADPTGHPSPLAPGDVDAAFLPWDLDSFLYPETDPAFSGQIVSGTAYSRGAQESAFKALNKLVFDTYQPELEGAAPQVDRFAAARTLVEQWYGGAGLPNPTYSDATTAAHAGWGSQSTLYYSAFARNCRTCHTLNAIPSIQFADPTNGYTNFTQEFMQNCAPAGAGPCLGKKYVFKQGVMPLSRLTLDRFWVNYAGGTSAADDLANNLQQFQNEADLLTAGSATPPGLPQPTVTLETIPLTQLQGERFDATNSSFTSSFGWNLYLCSSKNSMPAQSPGSCAAVPLVGSTTAQPSFFAANFGYYELTLTADNGFGGSVSPSAFEFFLPPDLPLAGSDTPPCLNPPAPPMVATVMAVSPCLSKQGLPPFSVAISNVPNGPFGGSTAGMTWNASVVAPTPATGPAVSITFTSVTSASATLYYQWCSLDGCTTGPATAQLINLLPLNDTLDMFWTDGSGNGIAGPSSQIALSAATSPPTAALGASLKTPLTNSLSGVPTSDSGTLVFGTPSLGSLSPTSFTGTASALPADLSTLTYSAPTPSGTVSSVLLTCDINGSCTGPAVTSTTQLTFGSNAKSGQLSIHVNALASFSSGSGSVYAVMTASCASCHESGTGTPAWTYTSGGTQAAIDATFGSFSARLTPGSPTSSAAYNAPCVAGDAPAGMGQIFLPSSSQCHMLYQWILEGGHEN